MNVALLLTLTLSLPPGYCPADEADIARARTALENLANRHAELTTMAGSFVQEIRTPLAKKPLISRGTLSFRRQPACAVFELTKPRHSIVRFDERSYRVYRPDEKRAETFIFKDNDLAGSFVQVFAPKTKDMEKVFRIAKSRPFPKKSDALGSTGTETPLLEVVLLPLDKKLENHFVELRMVLEPDSGSLRRITYTNAQGDIVAIILGELKLDPKIDATRFDSELPADTRIRIHQL